MQSKLAENVDTLIAKGEPSDQDFDALLQLARSSTVTDQEETATVLFNLDRIGVHFLQAGRSQQGQRLFEIAYEKALESLPNGVETAPTCNLARRLHRLHWTDAALALLRESVQLTDSEDASEVFVDVAAKPPRAAVLRNELGNLLREVGRLGEAEAELKHALRAVPPTEHGKAFLQLRDVVLNNLGIVYAEKEDPARAIEAFVESVQIQDKLSLSGLSLAITLDNLGRAYVSLSHERGPLHLEDGYINESSAQLSRHAGRCFARSEAIFRGALPEGAEDFVISLINAADLALYLDNLEEAASVMGEARRVFMETQLQNDAVMWFLMQKEVHLLRRQKRIADALALLRPLLHAFPHSHPPANDTLALLFELLATLSAEQGSGEDVFQAVSFAAAIDDTLLQLKLVGSSEQQSFLMVEHIAERTERLIGATLSCGYDWGSATEWLYALLLRRKGILSERMGSHWLNIGASHNARVAELSREVRQLRAEAAKIDLDGGEVTSIGKARRLRAEATRRLDDAEASLFGMIEQQHQSGRVVTPKDVCSALPNGAVLIDFATALPPTAGLRYVAFHVCSDGSIGLRDVGSVDDIDEQIEALTAELSRRPSVAGESTYASNFRNLYDTANALATTLLGSKTLPPSVLVAPVGLIATLPFAALPSKEGKDRELVCDHAITLVPSGRWLADTVHQGNAKAGTPIVIGNPNFDLGFDEDLPFSVGWRQPQLSAAEREARAVSELLGVSPLLGAAATREQFLAIKAPRILHVATHGTFLSAIGSLEEAKESRASIGHLVGSVYVEEETDFEATPLGASNASADAGLAPSELQRQRSKAREIWLRKIGPSDRQSRSVLMFAGVNAWLSGTETPEAIASGMVSAAEFSLLDLNGTELVVLSGCETASGAIDYVDGTVLGLRRSALLAGARASISTLWKVDDDATAMLMQSFYRHLQAGHERPEALRKAQLEVRNWAPHAYFWAAPVLEGDRAAFPSKGAMPERGSVDGTLRDFRNRPCQRAFRTDPLAIIQN